MELSNISIDSLDILLNSNIISDENFDELLSGCTALAISGKCNEKYGSPEISGAKLSNTVHAGIAYGNIVGLFVEAARHRYDQEHFINFLRTSKIFHGSRAEKLSNVYEKQREQLISDLTTIGNHNSYIVDVNWKLDYCVKGSTNNYISSCIYHIHLIIKKYGVLDSVNFTCTRNQLQDLVYKLRDAVRHVEKISHV